MDLGQGGPDGNLDAGNADLEYADKATLYVPVSHLHLISRYAGVSADEAPLPSWVGQWERPRKAAEQVRDSAAER
jgi:transcription-repair coupling factor (superfamily II helicase)